MSHAPLHCSQQSHWPLLSFLPGGHFQKACILSPLKGCCSLLTSVGMLCIPYFIFVLFILHHPIIQIHLDLAIFTKALKDVADQFLQKQMLKFWCARCLLGINT